MKGSSIFIRNLSGNVTTTHLHDIFKSFGKITDVIISHKSTSQSQSQTHVDALSTNKKSTSAIITFETEDAANKAVHCMHEAEVDFQVVLVALMNARKTHPVRINEKIPSSSDVKGMEKVDHEKLMGKENVEVNQGEDSNKLKKPDVYRDLVGQNISLTSDSLKRASANNSHVNEDRASFKIHPSRLKQMSRCESSQHASVDKFHKRYEHHKRARVYSREDSHVGSDHRQRDSELKSDWKKDDLNSRNRHHEHYSRHRRNSLNHCQSENSRQKYFHASNKVRSNDEKEPKGATVDRPSQLPNDPRKDSTAVNNSYHETKSESYAGEKEVRPKTSKLFASDSEEKRLSQARSKSEQLSKQKKMHLLKDVSGAPREKGRENLLSPQVAQSRRSRTRDETRKGYKRKSSMLNKRYHKKKMRRRSSSSTSASSSSSTSSSTSSSSTSSFSSSSASTSSTRKHKYRNRSRDSENHQNRRRKRFSQKDSPRRTSHRRH